MRFDDRVLDLATGGRARVIVAEPDGVTEDLPVLFLLHGLAATAALNWGTSIPALAQNFRLVAPDLRGHGRGPTTGRGTTFRLERCADDVAQLARQLAPEMGFEKITAVGYSMGGAVAQLTWRRHRELVEGLVLCATAPRFAPPRLQRLTHAAGPVFSLGARATPKAAWAGVAERWLGVRGVDPAARERIRHELEVVDPRAIAEAALAVGAFDSTRWCGQIDVPTGVVFTTDDLHVPPERQEIFFREIEQAQRFVVEGDHLVCVRNPAAFVPQLVDACRWVTSHRHANRAA